AACAKHFPGHGSTVEDSHLSLPALVGPIEAGLEPFRAAIAADVASIMTAHIKVNADAATLDPAVLHDLLRAELGFRGAIVADALEMKGVSARHGLFDAAVLAVEAGADALIVGHDVSPEDTLRIVAALDERVSRDRLEEAGARGASLAAFARPREAGGDREPALGAAARAAPGGPRPAVRGGRGRARETSRSRGGRRWSGWGRSPISLPVRGSAASLRGSSARGSRSPTRTCTSCATFIVILGWRQWTGR